MNYRRILLPLLAAALLAALAYAVLNRNSAPQVRFTTLDGQQLDMQQLLGKVVLVNFWATTCPGCIAEMPDLVKTYRKYHARGFELVAVAMAYDPPAQVANYAKSNQLPFPVALDTQGEIALAFNDVKLTPTAFLVDKSGRIVSHVVGVLDFQALNGLLEKELGEPN
jgi:peroxiredoxin